MTAEVAFLSSMVDGIIPLPTAEDPLKPPVGVRLPQKSDQAASGSSETAGELR